MSTLKELKFENLSKANEENFELDRKIIEYRKKFGVLRDNKTFLNKVGINSGKYGGRLVSLINRGHIEPLSTTTNVTKTSKNIYTLKGDVKIKAIKAIKGGMKNKDVSTTFNISLATVSRLKKRIVDGNIPNELKDVKPILKELEQLGNVVASFSKPTKVAREVKSTNSYTNAKGLNKDIARNKMVKYFVDSNLEGDILTLPHIACKIEKMILVDQPNQTFVGVECHKPTYNALRQTVRTENLPITTHFGKFSDKIYGEPENTYSGICGDYCGGMGKQSREVEYVIKNNLVKRGGIIALTFRKPLRGTNKDDRKIFDSGSTITNNENDNRCQSDRAMEGYLYRMIGNDYDLVEIFNYKDKKENGNDTQEMVLFIIKRK